MKKLFLFVLLCVVTAYPQTRMLMNRNGDAIPIPKGMSALSVLQKITAAPVNSSCGTQQFGYYPPKYTSNGAQYGLHNDILGMWFEAPTSGTIDTIFWYQNTICPTDSLFQNISVRMFHSNIYTEHGPGWGGYPAPQGAPNVTCWGYFPNTTDPENGIAAVPEDATGPWVSTVDSFRSSPFPSYPPMGANLWGSTGVPMHAAPNKINFVPLDILAVPTVTVGDPFFITLKLNGSPTDPCNATDNMSFLYSNESDTLATHDWKYYEYAVQPTIPCKGWVARGSWNLMFWYVMSPTSNTPPIVAGVDQIHNTTYSVPQAFNATIYDCDAENANRAGVAAAYVRYRLNGTGPWITDSLGLLLGDQYAGTIPGQPAFTSVEYKVIARDSTGLADSSGVYSYKVVGLDAAASYRIDTSSSCTPSNIASTGTAIDTSKWFIAAKSFAQAPAGGPPHRGDDGTAGPYAISNGFVFYGDTMHYAWVGVDGAIALSKTATDTIDVNSNGFGTDGWDLPFAQHHNRADTLHSGDVPKAFIAPFWADWIVKQDSPLATFGKIRYFDDSTKFVVEWDSIGAFFTAGAQPDIAQFRVVLNKYYNSVEFQYDDIGFANLDTANLTGMQSDSLYHPVAPGANPPFNYFNKDGYPAETHLHNGLCIHYVPVVNTVAISDGWNLLSIPANYSINLKNYLYPTAVSNAFIYNGGYQVSSNLVSGPAFWLKFSGSQSVDMIGRGLTCIDIPVVSGWNMIGSIDCPVPVANLTADAGTGINGSSTFFYYTGGYNIASTITPGFGYWVRASGSGNVHICCSGATKIAAASNDLANLTRLTISDKGNGSQKLYIGNSDAVDARNYEMPPRGPEGTLDARFASNNMVETFPSALDPAKKYEYPVQISATKYPVTIKWTTPSNVADKYSLTMKSDNGKILGMLTGSGKVTLNDASVKRVMISVAEGSSLPKVFALGRNYPNPFNPTTQFTVEMPRAGEVDVSIYDLLGRKIANLLSGEQSAGYHTMEWDSHDAQGKVVASGVYLIRMNVPSEQFSATQKVMLLK